VELQPRGHRSHLSGGHLSTLQNAEIFPVQMVCMGINAICEFGMRDQDVTRITRRAANAQRHTLMDTLRRAQKEGELAARTDIESLADFFESTLAGIRIAAKAGKTRPALDESLRLHLARFPMLSHRSCEVGHVTARLEKENVYLQEKCARSTTSRKSWAIVQHSSKRSTLSIKSLLQIQPCSFTGKRGRGRTGGARDPQPQRPQLPCPGELEL